MIYFLFDNQRPVGTLFTNDADLLFTWQPASGRGAVYQRRWFTIYLTTSVQPGRWLPTTLIYYLLDNQRPARALVNNDADLLFTWQPASGRGAGYQRRGFTI